MNKRPTIAPPHRPKASEDEGLERAQLCIRVMERLLEAVCANPKTEGAYPDLIDMFMDLLQEELEPYAFDLAYALFSQGRVATERRRVWESERSIR